MWRLIILFLGLWPASLRAQCPSMAQRYQRLTELSALPTPSQIITEASRLEKQSRACRATTDSIYAKTLHVLGRSYWYVGQLDTAVVLTKRAIAINGMNKSDVRRANLVHSYYNLGRIYGDKSDYSRAIQAFSAASRLAKQYPEKWASGASAYAEIAFIYYNIGDYEKAVNAAQEGVHLSQQANDSKMTANTLVQQAQGLIALNELTTANRTLQRALALTLQLKDLNITANVYSLLAKVANMQQSDQKAIQYNQQAFEINKRTNFRYGCAQSLHNMGIIYSNKLRQYDKALIIYRKALAYCDDSGIRLSLINGIGKAYSGLKQYPKALRYYQQALRLIDVSLDSTRFRANPENRFFKVAAHKEYLLALIQDKADTWLDYANATGNNRQRLKYALETYTVADQMIDFMRWEHTGQQSKLFWRDKTRGMYERAIETCFQLGDAEQAFRFLEKSRAVMLADKLNELGARQKLSRQQLEQEEQLQRTVSNQQSKLADIKPSDSTAYNSARMALLSKQDSLSQFLKNLEATNPAYYRYKYDNKTASLAELQRYLKKQSSSLITYFVGDSALYVLGVTGDTAILRKHPVAGYKQTLNQFARLLENPEAMSKNTDVARFRMLSNNLYRQLLAPLALPEGRVIVSPDGFSIPFDALSRSASQFDFAVNHYAFSYVYSASLLLKNGAVHARTPGYGRESFLGVAPVSFARALHQVLLPNSDTALASIANRFDSPTLLTHKAATRRNFLTQATTARIIHLFTHATADSTDQEPMLYFADSTLQLSDFSDNALPNAQLVVLAACKTGIGANQRGEGVFSLARGFAALGVPSVLTTLWSVQNEATYTLTDLFYKYIDEGLPKDIALQRAKQEWLQQAEGANGLPNYWAGLIVVGDAEPLPRINIVLWSNVLLGLLIIAGLIFWLERSKRRTTRPVSLPQPV